jgi:hypothetical protein
MKMGKEPGNDRLKSLECLLSSRYTEVWLLARGPALRLRRVHCRLSTTHRGPRKAKLDSHSSARG